MATPSPGPTPYNQTASPASDGYDSSDDAFEDDDDGLLPDGSDSESDSIDGFEDDDEFFYFPSGEFDESGATPSPRATTPAPVTGRSQPHTPMPAVAAGEDGEVDCSVLLSPDMSVSRVKRGPAVAVVLAQCR